MATPQLKTYFKKFKSDHLGQIQLTGIVNIRNFDTVNLEVTNWPDPIPNLTVAVHMGKISGATLAQEIDHFSLGGPVLIHTYSVAGPTLPSGFRERLPRLTSKSRPGCFSTRERTRSSLVHGRLARRSPRSGTSHREALPQTQVLGRPSGTSLLGGQRVIESDPTSRAE